MPNAGLGFVPYTPRDKAAKLIEDIKAVLHQYRLHTPLTARQIYYRLVAAHGYPKTKAFYQSNLLRVLNLARRGEIIDFDDIRDDSGTIETPYYDRNLEYAIRSIKSSASSYCRDKQYGQKYRTYIYCEAAGMVPQLYSVARRYGVSVHSKGGFDSVTLKYEFANNVYDLKSRAVVWHLGDFDPSGVSIYHSLKDDVKSFVRQLATRNSVKLRVPIFKRLALTQMQIKQHDLPLDTCNPEDRRSYTWDGVDDDGVSICQLEALPPDVIAAMVRAACTDGRYVDQDVYAANQARQKREREWLEEQLKDLALEIPDEFKDEDEDDD